MQKPSKINTLLVSLFEQKTINSTKQYFKSDGKIIFYKCYVQLKEGKGKIYRNFVLLFFKIKIQN